MFEYYQKRLTDYNKRYYKHNKKIRNNLRYLRIKKRRASDGDIGITRIFDPLYEKFAEISTRKKLAKEEFAALGYIPHFKKRLMHSM